MAEQYANCTVSHTMHSDRRFDLLAELGGWTRNDACFRMVQLWARCTALQTDLPPAKEIRVHLGLDGERLLLDSALGERQQNGAIRMVGGGLTGGDTDRFGWYEPVKQRNASGGRARADQAKKTGRGAGGRFTAVTVARPATVQPVQQNVQRPSSLTSETPASTGHPPASGFRIPEDQNSLSHAIPPTAVPDADPLARDREARRTVQREVRAELVAARRQAAAELRIVGPAVSLLAQDPGERDLAVHLVNAGPAGLVQAREQALHAIAMAKLEAIADPPKFRWLTGAIFAERNFRRLVATTAAEARRTPAPKLGRFSKPEPASMPQPAKFARTAPLADPVRDASEFLELYRKLEHDRARAPPASASATAITDEQQSQPEPAKAAT